MNASTQVICSFALTFGVPMVLAVREYWQLGPGPWHLPPNEPIPPDPAPLPDTGASPRYDKPLPACLIPQAAPARVRELA
ncbi:hypothetical protein [Rhodopila sp.]|uniref:hypothetical protein n=1 Tax=Rhodopila sp. TaxID=2480087 RepID=UPI003D12966F